MRRLDSIRKLQLLRNRSAAVQCSVKPSLKSYQVREFSSVLSPLTNLLRPNHNDIILEEQNMLTSLISCLRSIDSPKEEIDLIYDTRSRMDDLFLIVIVGEFNSGKSTLINALIGGNILKSGVLPTTNKVCIVRHESEQSSQGSLWRQADNMLLGDVQEMKVDLHWLKNIAIVDTPGTNAIVSDHEHLTEQIIPRADLILFVTSAERPMSDSESAILSQIKQWGKKVVMVVNKMDILQDPSEKEQVLDFVTQHAAKVLGDTVKLLPIFGVSGRLALTAKLQNLQDKKSFIQGDIAWKESKFADLEKYLTSVLGQERLILFKLKNPLGVADRVISDSINGMELREKVLEGDFRILEMIEDNMKAYKTELEKEITFLRSSIKTILMQINGRCDKFLDQNLTILKPSLLMDTTLFQEEFNREVFMDVSKPIDDVIVEICNLISKKSKNQANSVMNFVGTRPSKHKDSLFGFVNSMNLDEQQFEVSRYELKERIRRNINQIHLAHDQVKNVIKISSDAKSSFLQTAALQGVSVASIAALSASNIIGLTGILSAPGLILFGASGSMVLGLYILPRKKEIIRRNFSDRIENLHSQIDTVIMNDIDRELQSNVQRINDCIAPYSRFIDSEKSKLSKALVALKSLRKSTRDIQNKLK